MDITELLFSLTSLLFLGWVIYLKMEIDRLKREIAELEQRLNRFREKARGKAQKKVVTQSAMWGRMAPKVM